MQFRRLTRDAGLTSGWELEQRSRVGSHRSNSEHPRPPLHPASTRSRSQRCRDAGGTVLSQEAQEGGSFSAEAPVNPEYDEPRPSGALELWVGLAPFASGCVLHGGCGAGVRARPRGASSGDRADYRGVDREQVHINYHCTCSNRDWCCPLLGSDDFAVTISLDKSYSATSGNRSPSGTSCQGLGSFDPFAT